MPGLHRGNGHPEQSGGVLNTNALHVAQHDQGLVFLGQHGNGFSQ
jgi:hypothetical protein